MLLDDRLRRVYLDSLALVRELDFDVLVPWGDGPPVAETTVPNTRRRIDAIIARLENGETR